MTLQLRLCGRETKAHISPLIERLMQLVLSWTLQNNIQVPLTYCVCQPVGDTDFGWFARIRVHFICLLVSGYYRKTMTCIYTGMQFVDTVCVFCCHHVCRRNCNLVKWPFCNAVFSRGGQSSAWHLCWRPNVRHVKETYRETLASFTYSVWPWVIVWSLLDCYIESVISLVSDVYGVHRWEKAFIWTSFVSLIAMMMKAFSLLSLFIVLLLRSSLLVKRSLWNDASILQSCPWNGCEFVSDILHFLLRLFGSTSVHSWEKKANTEFVATGLITVCVLVCIMSLLHSGDWLYVIRFLKLSTCYYITVFFQKKSCIWI